MNKGNNLVVLDYFWEKLYRRELKSFHVFHILVLYSLYNFLYLYKYYINILITYSLNIVEGEAGVFINLHILYFTLYFVFLFLFIFILLNIFTIFLFNNYKVYYLPKYLKYYSSSIVYSIRYILILYPLIFAVNILNFIYKVSPRFPVLIAMILNITTISALQNFIK